ncbi:type III pantothenate kinase, partial [Francisella tularensis subsp. holarctica]|nr:type III pantothenate kinase [Francisella tularensis subsp. holarctica]
IEIATGVYSHIFDKEHYFDVNISDLLLHVLRII